MTDTQTDPCVATLRVLGHELRRPLTVLRGASTLLIDDADALPPASRQEMLSMIDRSATVMSDMIDDLMAAVHLDVGDVRYSLEPVDVAELVTEAVEAAHREDPRRPVDVRGLDRQQALEVEADREHALRVLRALLVNAVRFSPEEHGVEVVVGANDDAVAVEVLDRGPGIAPSERERAFEKFARLDPKTGGAGLGLYLARGLARGMGGDVSLSGREDGGTAVCFTLRPRG